MEFFAETSFSNCTTGPYVDFSVEKCMAAMEKMNQVEAESRRKILRAFADLDKTKCHKCDRAITVTNNGSGDTMEMCENVFAIIKAGCESGQVPRRGLEGIYLRPFPCEPKPRLR